MLIQTSPKVKEIESQLAKCEVTARLSKPVDYRAITEEAHAWKEFIGGSVGSS